MNIKIKNNELKFKYRVSDIIIKNDEVLLEKYGDNSFCLPRGYVEFDETSKEAVIRELKEETNITFNDVKYLGIIENFFTNILNEKTDEIQVKELVNT